MTLLSTSWGGGRRRLGLAAATGVAASLLAVPVTAASAATASDYLLTGGDGAAVLAQLGVTPTASIGGLTTAPLTARQVAQARSRGLTVTPDGPVSLSSSSTLAENTSPTGRLSVNAVTGASQVAATGSGITVAVLDSGVTEVPGLRGRVVQGADFSGQGPADQFGHGTFVAGLIAGDGTGPDGAQTGIQGIAPQARILSVKVADSQGSSTVSRLAQGIAWTLQNRDRYDVRVANLSLAVDGDASYLTGPVNALVEAAWYRGIVVVASAGNQGADGVRSAPGNDPLILTVGSVYDANTVRQDDDKRSTYSNNGPSLDGADKPELALPGQHVQSVLPRGSALMAQQTTSGLPAQYGQLSGTSMAAGVGSGMVAALLSARPSLTPDEVKGTLLKNRTAARTVDLERVLASKTETVKSKAKPSIALASAYAQLVVGTGDYSSVKWKEVDWTSVPWERVAFTQATWTNATWTNATWTNNGWTASAEAQATWTNATWTNATWTSQSSSS